MLAAGVVIADFEARFEREGGLVSEAFHKQWEAVVAAWWELAARYERLGNPSGKEVRPMAHAASVARMCRLPQGPLF